MSGGAVGVPGEGLFPVRRTGFLSCSTTGVPGTTLVQKGPFPFFPTVWGLR